MVLIIRRAATDINGSVRHSRYQAIQFLPFDYLEKLNNGGIDALGVAPTLTCYAARFRGNGTTFFRIDTGTR